MPAQKRSFPDSPYDHHHHTKHHHQEKTEEEEDAQQQEDNYESNGSDSHRAPSSPSEDNSEFVFVELLEIRKEVQCPICLGIIKKTRTVMECLHRFCRECIDKSMRLGNNECPACRTHCASRRSLRDDPNYDALIAALYPDIEKYEEEELEFREEDKNRNKLIQASIAKVVQRQSEALVKRRRDTPGSFVTRSQRNQRNVLSRRQNQVIDNQGSEDNEDENDNNEKDSSSTDERCTEFRQRRRKRRTRVRPSQPSSSTASPEGGCIESDVDVRENRGISSRPLSKPQKLTWGRGGFRSHTRHGSGSGNGINSKSARSSRLAKLVDYLRNLNENTDELDVHLILLSLDKQSTPSLQQPHLCCRPTLSVKHLCEYVAGQTSLPIEDVEILAVKGCCNTVCDKSFDETSSFDELTALIIDPSKDELETLQGHESLTELKSKCISQRAHMILAYRRKE
ncbi:putative E3 ubiquitin-protein ligase RING1a isoform X1 [Vigna unguiculata]|uniref:putative E3 ubiquitin-protein ligase RING1a isoform X1 n=1 Tax=Vigna unguiculata TaxID=3917 RepID=UPI001017122F|nr:putative E3 ubiquitin-protein ligase RING1a isoform X1 [Vigna unguiculata]